MSETSSPEVLSGAAVIESETPLKPGQLLLAARLKSGVHLAVLSVNLKVPVKELEALEADQLDPAKGPVFARALASSVCRQLRINPADVLALMPQGIQTLSPVRSVSPMHSAAPWRPLSRSLSALWPARHATLLVALMLALTAALIWLPSPAQWHWLQALPVFQKVDSSLPTASDPAFMSSAGAVTESVNSPTDQAVSQAAQVMVSASPLTVSSAAATALSTLPVLSKEPASTLLQSSSLVFAATEPSWIEVRDVNKQVLWSGVLPAGESKQLSSAPPLSVVIGRVQGISVTWRGQSFDLKPHSQATVARFELKP